MFIHVGFVAVDFVLYTTHTQCTNLGCFVTYSVKRNRRNAESNQSETGENGDLSLHSL